MTPLVLMLTTQRWLGSARLAFAFAAVGCEVQALCHRKHPLKRLSVVERIYDYNPYLPERSFRSAIEAAMPDLVVPCDDWAVRLLDRLYAREMLASGSAGPIPTIIRRSWGNPEAFPLLVRKSRLPQIAAQAGVSIPRTAAVGNMQELEDRVGSEGFPVVVKRDYGSGGAGVHVVQSRSDVKRAFARFTGAPNLARAIKLLLIDKNSEMAFDMLPSAEVGISVQQFIRGTPANCAVACWQGEILAAISAEAVATRTPTGRATILRIADHPDMLAGARRIVSTFALSGLFCGFDFMLEEESGQSYLIEINPRPTQLNHLPLGTGRDLVAALRAGVAGEPVRPRVPVTDSELVLTLPLLPEEERERLGGGAAYRDIPIESPELFAAYSAGSK